MTTDTRLLKAVQIATHKLSETGDFNLLLKEVLKICTDAVGASGGTIYLHEPQHSRLVFQHVLPEDVEHRLPSKDMADDFGTAGAAFQSRQTQIRVFPEKPESDRNPFEKATGIVVRNMVATPLMIEGTDPIGVVQLLNKVDGDFTDSDAAVLDIIANVATMAFLNSKLTEESNRASTLLGMGKVSHDIGNLAASLYATVSFAEFSLDQLQSAINSVPTPEPVVEASEMLPTLVDDMKTSVDRIVGYSRLISDMSAGKSLRPNFQPIDLAGLIQKSAAFFETDARSKRIKMVYEMESAGPCLCDELFLLRIVQNLVGNAVKAVAETIPDELSLDPEDQDESAPSLGEVRVAYRKTELHHVLEVKDTGPGMTPEIAARILGGNARSQWNKTGGSGWGMKIVRELATSLDGTMDIESELGKGSLFRVQFPIRSSSEK